MTDTPLADERRAVELRHALADRLEQGGHLRSAVWRSAVEAVPRHEFVRAFFRRSDGPRGTLWTPVLPGPDDLGAWLEEVYADVTLVTQLGGQLHPADVEGPVHGDPTSSSTLPSLVVRMLQDLDPQDGDRVLEIGTGTGYSTALMCERLGSEYVTSVEVDPAAAARARAALTAVGHEPALVNGDGLLGHPEDAPYDGLIATCSVRTVPGAWLEQVRPGGTIVTTVSGWLYGSGLVKLTVGEGGTAEGRFLPGTVRGHRALTTRGSGRTAPPYGRPDPTTRSRRHNAEIPRSPRHRWNRSPPRAVFAGRAATAVASGAGPHPTRPGRRRARPAGPRSRPGRRVGAARIRRPWP